jgi:hypothetical protein
MEWFLILGARESEPLGFTDVIFGVGDYDWQWCYIAEYGPCHPELGPLEIPSDAWPGPVTGTSVSWPTCLEGNLVPIYYFGVYVYGPGQIPFGDFYPGHPSVFFSCTDPSETDDITAFGTIGFGGAEGENPCPTSSVPDDIGETEGESTTWGQIKTLYR